MAPVRAAFVIEQTLGHVTHYRNLRESAATYAEILPVWLPISFPVSGPERFVPILRANWSVRASWRARKALRSAIEQPAVDALFFHTQVTALFSQSLMKRVPTVISLDATPINYDSVGEYYNHRPAGNGLVDRRKYALTRQTFQSAAALIAWSEWARRSLIEDYGIDGRRTRVISPGVGPAYFELGDRRTARESRQAGDPIRVLFVGGDFVRKGGPLLIECMQGSLKGQCVLDVVTQSALPAVPPDVRVHTGLGPNSDALRRLFADADVFVLPTRADCLALVLMEAAAAGLPVVATNIGALQEAFIPGESGLMIPVNDAAALTRALSALLVDEQLRRRLGSAGRNLARQRFNARQNNRQLFDAITEIAHTRQTSGRAA